MEETITIIPQKWYQEKVLSSPADVVVWWGQAWAWKTYSLLLDPLRWKDTPWFNWMLFRRTTPQITLPGWLWDTSLDIYPWVWWNPVESRRKYSFESWAQILFSHLEYEKDKLNHQWWQYAFIWFDELTHFTKTQFFYLLSRNRSTCWIKPYVRCTCNPDAESWVKEFIDWWIDEDWFPIAERDWVLRYFIADWNNLSWWNTKEEVIKNNPHLLEWLSEEQKNNLVLSMTFIAWTLDENEKLLEKDPTYKAKLMALPEAEKKALLLWCWKPVQNDLAIANYSKLVWLFTNFPTEATEKYITCDVARFWRDLATIITWEWWKGLKLQIFTKSWLDLLRQIIEKERQIFNISISNVLIDQDWLWGWLVDEWKYIWFSWWATTIKDPNTEIKENYKNLKTQCYYRMIEENINTWEISIDTEEIYVDWVRTSEIKIGNKLYDVKKLILDDIKAIRRAKTDIEGKLQINSKEEQKNIIWRSPDFGDNLMMRKWFDIAWQKTNTFWMA